MEANATPLSRARRLRVRDDCLWLREVMRARFLNIRSIHCPCSKCKGKRKWLVSTVRHHLICNGRHSTFRVWRGPGERHSSDEEWEEDFWRPAVTDESQLDVDVNTHQMVNDVFDTNDNVGALEERARDVVMEAFTVADEVHNQCSEGENAHENFSDNNSAHTPNAKVEAEEEPQDATFDATALEDAMYELYTGAKCTTLAATILLMNLCTVHGVSNSFVDELLSLLQVHLLPEGNTLPKNHYAAKTLTRKLGLTYNSIHACENGCVLFRGEYADLVLCPICNGRRYKDEQRKKFPLKVLRHFPIIPRLQRMYRSPAISELLRWHSHNKSNRDGGDNLVRHPCDSKAWYHFHNVVDPSFGEDPRNVHFALAADGVNPFKQTRSTWSTWPVLLLNYNLPPWLSTKKFFVQLALLIPGKQSVTSEVFDVYVEPVIQEFLQLWEGIPAYDVNSIVGSRAFNLRAVLLWTIHDFPGYGTVGGFAHQGFAACPDCGCELGAEHSIELGKCTYGGTRRWLPEDHIYRSEDMKCHFNGEVERRSKPKGVSVHEQLLHAEEYEAWKALGNKPGASGDPSKVHGVKRKSAFYILPYWTALLIRHTLDPMHCEMNLAKNFLKTITGKKDTVKVRRDLQRRKIRPHLWLTPNPKRGGKIMKPLAPYVLSDAEFNIFASTLESLKTPSGYSSSLGKHIRNKKFGSLKSHDYHVFMQQLLPLALRGLLQPGPRMAVMRMSKVFRRLCTNVYNPVEFQSLEVDVAESMSLLEMEFPPSFFDIMTHLPYHLVKQLDICGPVASRWMYPIERYMKTLKKYVRNMARPEASMAEGYLKDECIGFVTEYLQGFDATHRRVWDAEEEYGDAEEVLEGVGKPYMMTKALRDVAHQYVCNNATVMQDWLRKWKSTHDSNAPEVTFEEWVKQYARDNRLDVSSVEDMDRLLLCNKPSQKAKRYTRMKAFGNHYRVDDESSMHMLTYDSGVASVFHVPTTDARDVAVNYVGVLKDILKLDYGPTHAPVVVLRCEWLKRQDNRGNPTYIRDEAGFLLVNFRHKLPRMAEPFIFSNQATQVFFSDVLEKQGWKVVLRKEPRSRREVLDTPDVFITTTVECNGLTAPMIVPNLPISVSLVGAIELSAQDHLLASAKF